jgi:hypothetical protein
MKVLVGSDPSSLREPTATLLFNDVKSAVVTEMLSDQEL